MSYEDLTLEEQLERVETRMVKRSAQITALEAEQRKDDALIGEILNAMSEASGESCDCKALGIPCEGHPGR